MLSLAAEPLGGTRTRHRVKRKISSTCLSVYILFGLLNCIDFNCSVNKNLFGRIFQSVIMAPRFELAVGLRKGHKTTKISAGRKGITDKAIRIRPARLKGLQTKHSKFVRDLVREVVGHAQYEKRAMELLKKIKPKDIAEFIVTHEGELKKCLNTPKVDQDKACARLLLHKALQHKYKFMRDRFSNVPIKDLFMSRLERKKMKKEEREKKKNKKNNKNAEDNKVINSEGDWKVEDIETDSKKEMNSDDDSENDDSQDDIQQSESENELVHDDSDSDDENLNTTTPDDPKPKSEESLQPKESSTLNMPVAKSKKDYVKIKSTKIKTKHEQNQKDIKKKNFKEKMQQKKLREDSKVPIVGDKIVDPFFITSTGENYMSVVEPRGPDEVKDEHKQGNRKLRRAVMFGHVPKNALRRNNYNNRDDNRFNNNQNGYGKRDNIKSKFDNRQEYNKKRPFNNSFNDRNKRNNENSNEKEEKLHPSWEAKKKKSGILPFEGKKIVFD